MKLNITKEWLDQWLTKADDTHAAAGGTEIALLKKDVEARTVTPSVLGSAPTEVGKVVRFIREQRGLTVSDLASIASVDENDIKAIETEPGYTPSPRTIVYLADALNLSRDRLKKLVGFVVPKDKEAANEAQMLFAAKSRNIETVSSEEFEAIRALVEALSEKTFEG